MSIDLGTDISTPLGDEGLPDLDPFFGLVEGIELLAQDLYARIVTPTGGLIDDESYGHDVREALNDSAPSTTRIAAAVRAQWLSDERVEEVAVDVTLVSDRLLIEGRVLSAAGPFRLTIAVGAVTSELLAVEAP